MSVESSLPTDTGRAPVDVNVTGSGAVAAGGDVTIVGALAAGRDIHLQNLTIVNDDGPPVGDQAARPGAPSDRCPYPGLVAFGAQDADLFFGRDDEVRAVLDLISRSKLVAIVGSSGSGKSSLIAAGVLPALAGRDAQRWVPVLLRPGPDPIDTLRRAQLPVEGAGRPLWIIDQFEEIFDPGFEPEREQFLTGVLELTNSTDPGCVIVAIRSDFYANLDASPPLARLVAAAQYRLVPLDLDAVQDAVVEPAELVGLRVEPALIAQLRAEVAANPNSQPLLGYALRQTWRRRHNGWLTLAGYVDAGGIGKALEHGAEHAWGQLSPAQQETTHRALLRLSHIDERGVAVRRRCPIADLVTDLDSRQTVVDIVNVLATNRLVTVSDDPSVGPVVEIAHESLLREWPLLRGWLRDDQETARIRNELVDAVDMWNGHAKDVAYLLPAPRVAAIDAWQRATKFSLTGSERTFLSSSRRRARRARRLRRSLPVLAGLVVIALVVTGLAVASQRRADRSRHLANALQTAANARSVAAGQRDLGVLLALAAYRGQGTDTTFSTLVDSVASPDGPSSYLHPAPFADSLATTLTSDGDAVVGLSDGRIQLVRPDSASAITILTGHADAVGAVASFGAGLIASADISGTILIHRENEAQPLVRLTDGGGSAAPVIAVAADAGRGVVIAASGSTLRRFQLADPLHPLPALTASNEITSIAVDEPSGQLLAATRTGNIERWNLDSGAPLPPLASATDPLDAIGSPRIALNAAGALAAVDGGNLYMWSSVRDTNATRTTVAAPGSASLVWDPASGQVLVGGVDGVVTSWQPGSPPLALGARFRGLAAASRAGSPGPPLATDGKHLIGLDATGALLGWGLGASTSPAMSRLDSFTTNVLASAWSSTGVIATGAADGSVHLRPADGGAVVQYQVPGPIGGLAWRTPDQLVIGAGDGAVYLLANRPGAKPEVLAAPQASSTVALAAAPNSTVAAVTRSGQLEIITATGQVARMQQLPVDAHALAVSSTGLIAVGTGDGTKTLITLEKLDGSQAIQLHGHRLQVDSLAFSPDGKTLASGSDDQSIRLWSSESGKQLAILTGHTDMVQALGFSPNGELLASSGQDGTLRLWSVSSRSEIGAPLIDQAAFVATLAISADGRHLVTGNGPVVDSWPFGAAGWAAGACRLADRNLNPDEWNRYAVGITPHQLC